MYIIPVVKTTPPELHNRKLINGPISGIAKIKVDDNKMATCTNEIAGPIVDIFAILR
jgi:hypothetical protein